MDISGSSLRVLEQLRRSRQPLALRLVPSVRRRRLLTRGVHSRLLTLRRPLPRLLRLLPAVQQSDRPPNNLELDPHGFQHRTGGRRRHRGRHVALLPAEVHHQEPHRHRRLDHRQSDLQAEVDAEGGARCRR